MSTGPSRSVGLVVAGSVVQIASLAPVPLVVRELFGTALPAGDTGTVIWLGLLLLGLQVANGVATLRLRRHVAVQATRGSHEARTVVTDHLLRADLETVRRRSRSTWSNALNQQSRDLEMRSIALNGQVLPGIASAILILVVLSVISWELTLVLAICVWPLVWVIRLSRDRSVVAFTARQQAEAELLGESTAMLEGLETIRSYEAVEWQEERVTSRSRAMAERSTASYIEAAFSLVSTQAAVAAMVTVLLVVGALLIAADSLSVADFIAFTAGVAVLKTPLGSVGGSVAVLAGGTAAERVIAGLMDGDRPRPARPTSPTPVGASIASVELIGVGFSYGESPVLRDVSLRLERGSLVALVGPNGAGKTTLVHLVLGLFVPSHGELRVNGQRLSPDETAAFRRRVGVTHQSAELFNASIIDNITMGRSFDPDAIDEALRITGLSSLIEGLPEGIETVVGDGGRQLSKGQLQRIALARALIGQPELIILDEPTNHLDPDAVEKLLLELRQLPSRPAVLLVSHDHRAIDGAQAIYRMDHGELHVDRASS